MIPMPPDGSCFFHSIVFATNIDYLNNPDKRYEIVLSLRKKLAEILDYKKDDNITWYNYLSRGHFQNLSQELNEYSLQNMQKELLSMGAVDEKYFELISDLLNIDIYVINSDTNQLVNLDKDIYYKNRYSLILYFHPSGHYDILSVKRNDVYYVLFKPNDNFILLLQNQLK
jgi:hypothetical protein